MKSWAAPTEFWIEWANGGGANAPLLFARLLYTLFYFLETDKLIIRFFSDTTNQ